MADKQLQRFKINTKVIIEFQWKTVVGNVCNMDFKKVLVYWRISK